MNEKKWIVISILLIFLLTVGSYLFENIIKQQGLKSGEIIKITEKRKVIAFLSADILTQLMKQNSQEDDVSMGPSLLLTINAVGVSEFEQIEVTGKYRKETFVLHKEDINDDLLLVLESNGTVNLYKKNNDSKFLVKEVTEISIRN
ncbi:hypothetical protein [Clostridium polyendosporum]|nr:hypothetical protein [Clostridium polyendosporum]